MNPPPGSIVFHRSRRPAGVLVLLGSWIRFRRAKWTHVCVVGHEEDGQSYVIQAQLKGVTDSMTFDELREMGECEVMAPPEGVDIDRLLDFCEAQVGDTYDVLTDLALAIDALTWRWFPAFRGARKNSWQCAALVCEGLRFGGWYHPWISIYDIFPDELYAALTKGEA